MSQHGAAKSRRITLHQQAVTRMTLILVLAMIGILLIGLSSYSAYYKKEALQKQTLIADYYRNQLPRLDTEWRVDAEQIRARIEFSRILESSNGLRWAKLNAMFNAQWEFIEFSNLLVLDRSGKIVFRYGTEAHALEDTDGLASGWLYSSQNNELYQVFRLPLWMGEEGHGKLLLFKPLNTSILKKLEILDTHLHLKYKGDTLASSSQLPRDSLPLERSVLTHPGSPRHVEAALPWPGSDNLQLLVQRDIHFSYPLPEFLMRPVAAIILVSVLLILGLGRWLGNTVKRLESISAAARNYHDTHKLPLTEQGLLSARGQHDEIHDLATLLLKLVQTVDARDREQRAYLDTLSLLEEAVLELDCDGRIQHASMGWNKLAHSEDSSGHMLYEFIHPDDQDALRAQCQILQRNEKDHVMLRIRLNTATQASWLECRFISHRDESGTVLGIRGVLRDITQTYLHEKQITHMALHDALTGLPNRLLLEDRLKIALRLASRTESMVGIFFIDLDHFKNINDSLGHKAGDKLLIAFSEALHQQLRAGDTLARWGGDEFVLLLPDIESESDIREVARKITLVAQTQLRIDDAEISATFSMGVAVYPDDGEDMESLFSQADRAMFYAKSQGRNQVCFFRDMTSKGIGKKELYIQNRLNSAITNRRIEAWFQPIVAASTQRCTGVEVLARWHDDEHGHVSPDTFIPMAENIGLIRELGQQVWQAGVDTLASLRQAGYPLTVAINISKRQLYAPFFTEQLLETLASPSIHPSDITLEITESVALLDVEHAADRLLELKQAGFKIAIDDFGTGYSSLSQLHEMHVDELKIDISFVRRLDDPRGLSMTQAIINLARALNLKTVAEGVENEATALRLRQLGVDYLQGYYYAKPMPRQEFEHWLREHAV